MSNLRKPNAVPISGNVTRLHAQIWLDNHEQKAEQTLIDKNYPENELSALEKLLKLYRHQANAPTRVKPNGHYFVDFDYTEGDV